MTTDKKFYTVSWAQRVGKFYARNEQTVKGETMREIVIAAVKRLPNVPSKSVSWQGAPSLPRS